MRKNLTPEYLPRAVAHQFKRFVVKDYTIDHVGFIAFYKNPPKTLPNTKLSGMLAVPSHPGYFVFGSGSFRLYQKLHPETPLVLWENPKKKTYNPYKPIIKEFLTDPKNQCIPIT